MTKPFSPVTNPSEEQKTGCPLSASGLDALKNWLLKEPLVAIRPAEWYIRQFNTRFQGQLDTKQREDDIKRLLRSQANAPSLERFILDNAQASIDGQELWGRRGNLQGLSVDQVLHCWEARFLAEKAYSQSGSLDDARSAIMGAQKTGRCISPLLSGRLLKSNCDDSIKIFWGALVYYICAHHGGEADTISDRSNDAKWQPSVLSEPDAKITVSEQELLGGLVLSQRGKGTQPEWLRKLMSQVSAPGPKNSPDDNGNANIPLPPSLE